MKNYLSEIIDLTSDGYLNPTPAVYDNGIHSRAVSSIKSISVHHDASVRPHDYDSVARYKQEAAQHYQRLGPGLQYHYKIDNVGQIFQIRPLDEWLYCVGSAENVSTIAICLDGYLHNDETNQGQDATKEQYEALYQLLEYLCTQRPDFAATWPDVRPHQDFSSTACCGNRMTGHIYPIQDDASAQAALLNQGTYDWPELQPSYTAPKPTPVTPAPAVPTPPSQPDPAQTPPPTYVPPAVPVSQQDHTQERLNALEKLVNIIFGYLMRYKTFQKFYNNKKGQ